MEEVIIFRLANDNDIEAINVFYNSIYQSKRDLAKFNWEFNSSPAGKSIYVIAECGNKIIGTQCVIPYYIITHENETVLSGKSEDTLVSPIHRGKNIFEKMYALIIEECNLRNIQFIWGFTYATKPFLKLKFEIPFRSSMGILVNKPLRSASYLSSLSAKNNFIDKFKIFGLSIISWLKSFKRIGVTHGTGTIDFEPQELNTSHFNYLNHQNSFGLKLDKNFLDYRIMNNPYNKNYKTLNYRKNGILRVSLVYTISKQGVGYIINLYVAEGISKQDMAYIFKSALKNSDLRDCNIIRFWGFSHNNQNSGEIQLLKNYGFTFINRGISFVWLNLREENILKPEQFVLSRMASQGTD